MFFEELKEIYFSIRHNRVRVFLSGFGVSWGILILVLMLGAGQGFQEAVMKMFSVFAQKSMYVYGGETSQKYKNINEGAEIKFNNDYLTSLKNRYKEISLISPEVSTNVRASINEKEGVFRCIGVNNDYMKIKILKVKETGRAFNLGDVLNRRNVVIIGESVAAVLFGNREPLNRYINLNGLYYKIIGVLKNEDIFSSTEINSIYVPFTTYKQNISSTADFKILGILLNDDVDSKAFEAELRNYISHKSNFDIDDKQAVYIANYETQTSMFESLFKGLKMFTWIVGICFLISGIVGICNIMLVVVRERTNEIGIRMAVGALPKSIVNMVILESVVITFVSGVLGMIVGRVCLLIIDWMLSLSTQKLVLIEKTTFELQAVLAAIIVLVIAGIIAGLFPAIRAAQIEPVDAIRYESRE